MYKMSVISKMREFLQRHRNKFVITSVVLTSAYLASRYAQHKIREWQERETKEFLDRTRKSQHFESTERTCNQTIVSLSLTLNEAISQIINTDDIVSKLRENPPNRIELWDTLKISVFSRLCTLVYVNTLLVIILRVQLNLIGGYLFKDTKSITSDIQQNYLSMCHLLLDNGLKKITLVIQEKISEIMSNMKLNKRLSLYDVEQIFWNLEVKLCENNLDPIKHVREYVIPEEISDTKNVYNNMMRETADLLESEEVCNLATTCTNRGFSHLVDKLSEYYAPPVTPNGLNEGPSTTKDLDTFLHPSQVQIPLAKLIPILNGLLTKNSFPESLTQQLIHDNKLKTLGANIYEVFSHNS